MNINKTHILLATVLVVFFLYATNTRTSTIINSTWKNTCGTSICSGIISFGTKSSYEYQWPVIKRNNTAIGIVVANFNDRLIVLSLSEISVSFFMKI
jgi:hypothetical protein